MALAVPCCKLVWREGLGGGQKPVIGDWAVVSRYLKGKEGALTVQVCVNVRCVVRNEGKEGMSDC